MVLRKNHELVIYKENPFYNTNVRREMTLQLAHLGMGATAQKHAENGLQITVRKMLVRRSKYDLQGTVVVGQPMLQFVVGLED